MKKSFLRMAMFAVLAGLTACASNDEGILLKGQLVGGKTEDAVLNYCPNGNIYENQMMNLELNEDGQFTFDTELPNAFCDVTVEMSGIGYFGVHLLKDQTVSMSIQKEGDQWKAVFEGPEADVSTYYNQYTQLFDMMKYWSPDPSEGKPIEEYRQLLDNNYEVLKAELQNIQDEEQREYYTRLTDLQHRWLTIRLIMDSCFNDKTNYKENVEYVKLLEGIDYNDPLAMQTNMAYTALNGLNKEPEDGDGQAACLRLMQLTDSLVTNPEMRHFMVQMIGQQYYTYGNGEGDYETFNKKFLEWAGDQDRVTVQSMIDQFLQKKKSTESTKAGAPAPDVELTTPAGKKVMLSSLLQGKFTYIDVWATWCGPCCKEIPFVEKLVEKYKGNDKVQFLSISIDQNEKAWKTKIEKDQPQWAQFIIQGEVEAAFSKSWGISGIPRFIMINPDGTIFNADASRPSDAETVSTIDAQIGKK